MITLSVWVVIMGMGLCAQLYACILMVACNIYACGFSNTRLVSYVKSAILYECVSAFLVNRPSDKMASWVDIEHDYFTDHITSAISKLNPWRGAHQRWKWFSLLSPLSALVNSAITTLRGGRIYCSLPVVMLQVELRRCWSCCFVK